MSGGKFIKQAVIAALCEHPDAEKYRQRALLDPEQALEAIAHRQTLTKADFLTPDDDGKLIIDSIGAWKNFDKIVKIVQTSGSKFTYEDFMTPLGRDTKKTLLDSALVNRGLEKLFSLNVWKGRYDEMERLWYKVPFPDRRVLFKNDGLLSIDLKRQMFEAEGRVPPEDRLASAGLTPADLRRGMTDNAAFEEVSRRLQLADDYFRKEYVLLMDNSGDTLFGSNAAAWTKYDAIVKSLRSHGENLEVADYTRRVTFAPSILMRAGEQKSLNKIFNPAHWVDRLSEMDKLWSHVLDGWKTPPMTTSDFDNAYAEAESLTYLKHFQAMKVTGKADLLQPLGDTSTGKAVYPLGLKAVWEKFDSLQDFLVKNDEPVTIADLRLPSGPIGNTCLLSAAKFGHFDKVANIAKRSGEALTLEDFLSKDRNGNTLIGILAEKNQLALVFTPQLWVGKIGDMRTLWSHVSIAQRKQVDFPQVEIGVKQATLKQKKGGFKLQPDL
jgi:hypothetical protein